MAQPDAGAQVEQVRGRDPRFRQPADHQQLAQMPGVGAIALRALLGPAPRRGLGRLGEMDARANGAPNSSTTNRQPVVASSATSSSWPPKRAANRRTAARSAGATRARGTTPGAVPSHSAGICARWWSETITIVTRGLLTLHGRNACAAPVRA